MKKNIIEIVIVLALIFVIFMLGIIYKQTKRDDLGYHEVADCIEINNDIYCKIAPAVDY